MITKSQRQPSDQERAFGKLLILSAHAGTIPQTVAGLDDDTKQRLEKNPNLRQGWEIVLSVVAETPRGGFVRQMARSVRTVWQRRRRDRMVNEIAYRFMAEIKGGCCWVTMPVGGETDYVTTQENMKQVQHPEQDAFLVRTLGLPADKVRQLAAELGKAFRQSKVQIRAFGQNDGETLSIPD